jgi:hypothetical protein
MGWDKGRYYTRSRKVNGRVVREYVGSGPVAALAAQMDALERERKEAEAAAWRAEKARLDALDADVAALIDLTDLLARAALRAAGFHQHKRGEWRKRRGNGNGSDGPHGPEGAGEGAAACPQR